MNEMSDAKLERDIGMILAELNGLKTGQLRIEVSMREFHATTRMQLQKLETFGCAAGQQHAKEIAELRELPAKSLGMAATVAGLITFIGGGFMWLLNNWHHGTK